MLIANTIMVIIILVVVFQRGLTQTSGRAKGPKHSNARTTKEEEKYHFFADFTELSRNSPQKRHLTASSCICSAQKGHFFTMLPSLTALGYLRTHYAISFLLPGQHLGRKLPPNRPAI